jgi:hypothetical protein
VRRRYGGRAARRSGAIDRAELGGSFAAVNAPQPGSSSNAGAVSVVRCSSSRSSSTIERVSARQRATRSRATRTWTSGSCRASQRPTRSSRAGRSRWRAGTAKRRWWLRRFDNETIAALAADLFGVGKPQAVGVVRARLLGC